MESKDAIIDTYDEEPKLQTKRKSLVPETLSLDVITDNESTEEEAPLANKKKEIMETPSLPLLANPLVMDHAKILRWIALDPELKFIPKEYMDKDLLRTRIWVMSFEEHASYGWPEELYPIMDVAFCRAGVQKLCYFTYVEDFLQALLRKEEEIAATLCTRVYLLEKHGTMQINTWLELKESTLKTFPFLTQQDVDSPFAVLYCVIYTVADSILKHLAPEIASVFAFYKQDPEVLMTFLMQAIVCICRGEGSDLFPSKRSLLDKPLVEMTQIIKVIGKNFEIPDPTSKMQEIGFCYYAQCMSEAHPHNFELHESDVSYLFWLEKQKSDVNNPVPLRKEEIPEEPKEEPKDKKRKRKEKPIPELPIPLTSEILHLNVRANKKKKFNYLVDPTCVIKGPFASIERFQKLAVLLEFIDLGRLGVKILMPKDYYRSKGKYYVSYPVLHTKDPVWLAGPTNDIDGREIILCPRNALGIMTYSEYILSNPKQFKKEHFPIIYTVLFWFTLLHIGDRSLDNILVVGNELWFLDFDVEEKDPLPTKLDPHTLVLSKKPKKEIEKLFQDAYEMHILKRKTTIHVDELCNIERLLGIDHLTENSTPEAIKSTGFTNLLEDLGFDKLYCVSVYSKISQILVKYLMQ